MKTSMMGAAALAMVLGMGFTASAQADDASDYVSCIKGLQAIAPPVPNNGWFQFEGESTFGLQCYMQDNSADAPQISFVFLAEQAGFRSVVYPVVQYVGKYSWGTETVKLPRNIIELRSKDKTYYLGNYLGVFDLVEGKDFNAYITRHTEFGHTPAKAKQVLIDRYPIELKGRAFPALEKISSDEARSCLLTKVNMIADSAASAKGIKVTNDASRAQVASQLVPSCRNIFRN